MTTRRSRDPFVAALLLAAAGLLGACTSGSAATPLPTGVLAPRATAPADVPGATGGGPVASGVVVAGQQADLAFALSGQVESVAVARGETVTAGQVLARLTGGARQTAAVEAARLEQLAAQQALQDLKDGAGLAAAQATLAVAQARDALERAQTALRQYAAPDLAYYEDQVARAQARLTAAEQNAAITNFEVELKAAQDALDAAASVLDQYKTLEAQYPGYSNQHGDVLANAQKAYDRALDAYQTAQYRLQQAQTNDSTRVADAQQAYDTAVANLAAIRQGPNDVRLAIAQGQVAVAQAALEEAEARAARLADGVDADQLALAQARVANAEAQRAAAEAAVDDLVLKAPFAGTLTAVHLAPGEWVTAGQAVLVLGDLAHLRVETTDLSERDVPAVAVGQRASVFVEALNLDLTARVHDIAPTAEALGGDVIYRTTLDLDTWPPSLRVGMSVEVRFGSP